MSGGTAGRHREYALSEVVGFVLLLGVIVTAMALWMVYIVPVNGREAEISHMNDVKDRFTDYKISLDSLWVNSPYWASSSGPTYSQAGVTLSTSMNLGTGGGDTQASGLFLPMLNPIASSAVLSLQNTTDTLNISSQDPSGVTFNTYNMSILKYQSKNNYWIQQAYYYQDGGVFLSQQDGSTCRVAPPISFTNNTGSCSVSVTPIILYGGGSIGGSGPVRVDTRLKARDPSKLVSGNKYWVCACVTVADYSTAHMWLDVFNNTRRNGGINSSVYFLPANSSPTASGPGWASMTIYGPASGTAQDVSLYIQPAEYDVILNNLVSNLN
jgi:hypothetical protein